MRSTASNPLVGLAPQAVLRTLLLTDLVDSTKLLSQLSDAQCAEVFALHDRLARDLFAMYGGREIDKTDGFLVIFERPIEALQCALTFHDKLADLSGETGLILAARAGIHLGEVILRENSPEDIARGAKPLEVEGYTKPTAARLMALALGRQTLVSRIAFDLARRALRGTETFPENVKWLAHGPYLFKGADESVEVCEVGVEGFAPLLPPPDGEKARRAIAPGDELTLGWRPAKGQEIPNRKHWLLDEKLGEGGFGEVWLAGRGKEKRVFKFCFHPDRLRALKREVVLFRLLQETLGDRDDIASIIDWQFDEAPYWIESQYTQGGNLLEWAEEQGGIANVPEDVRLELAAEVADALAAAHSVGVLHKDIKPSNVLIYTDRDGEPRVRLTDFGIGMITDRSLLEARGITATGITETSMDGSSSSHSGTRIYMAPELLEGKPATTLSDIYALGVMVYQMMCGDLRRAMAPGWERGIEGEILREDIAACVDGHPQQRIPGMIELSERLRTVSFRQQQRELERRQKEESHKAQVYMERSRKRRKFLIAFLSLLGFFIIALSALTLMSIKYARDAKQGREQADVARGRAEEAARLAELNSEEFKRASAEAAEAARKAYAAEKELERELYFSNIVLASSYMKELRFDIAEETLARTPSELRRIEWGLLKWQARLDLRSFDADLGPVSSAALAPGGSGRVLLTHPGAATLWDMESGIQLAVLPSGYAAAGSGQLSLAVFSADGSRIAASFPPPDGEAPVVRIWNAANPGDTPAAQLTGFGAPVTALSFNPERPVEVMAASLDGTLRVFDARTGHQLHRFDHGGETAAPLLYGAYLDGTRAASCGTDGRVRIWDTVSGREDSYAGVLEHPGPVYWIDVNATAKKAVCAYMMRDEQQRATSTMQAWDFATSTGRWQPHGGPIGGLQPLARPRLSTEVAASTAPPGHFTTEVVTAALDGPANDSVARLYKLSYRLMGGYPEGVAPLEETGTFRGHSSGIHDAIFGSGAHSGIVLTVSEDRTARLWRKDTGLCEFIITGHSRGIRRAAFSSSGSFLLTASDDGTARLWDAFTRPELAKIPATSDDKLSCAALSPDGDRVVLGSTTGHLSEVLLSRPDQIARELPKHELPISDVAWSPSGGALASASWMDGVETGCQLHLFSVDEGRILLNRGMGADGVRALAFLSGGGGPERLVFGRHSGAVQLLAVDASPLDAPGEVGQLDGPVIALATAAGHVAALSGEGQCQIWKVDPDGSATGRLDFRPEGGALSIALDAPGRLLAVGGSDHSIRLYNLNRGGEPTPIGVLEGHEREVTSLAFTGDGAPSNNSSRLISTSKDGTFKVWDLSAFETGAKGEGRVLVSMPAGSTHLRRTLLSGDMLRILTVGEMDCVRVWQLVPWRADLSAAGEDLSRAAAFNEWHREFSRERFRAVAARQLQLKGVELSIFGIGADDISRASGQGLRTIQGIWEYIDVNNMQDYLAPASSE